MQVDSSRQVKHVVKCEYRARGKFIGYIRDHMRDEKESVNKHESEIKEIAFNTIIRNLIRKVFLKELKKIIIFLNLSV